MTRRLAIAVAALAVSLTLPAAAAAEEFYVAADTGDDQGNANPCTDQNTPCKTIARASSSVFLTGAGPHTIFVKPGTYAEAVNFGNAQPPFDGLTLDGSWQGAPGERATITSNDMTKAVIFFGRPGTTITHLQLVQQATNMPALVAGGAGSTVRDVSVSNTNAASLNGATRLEFGTVTLDRVTSTTVSKGPALVVDGSASGSTVLDSTFAREGAAGGESTSAVLLRGASTFQRVRIRDRSTATTSAITHETSPGNPVVTLDDVLVTGGNHSLEVKDLGGVANSPTIRIRHSTLDARGQGFDSTGLGNQSIWLNLVNNGSSPQVQVQNSILVDSPGSAGSFGTTPSVACTDTTLPAAPLPPGTGNFIACAPGASGNQGFNDPLDIFVGPASSQGFDTFDWRLKPGSAAIDSGSGVPLAPDESATDLDGNPRLASGAQRCDSAPRDRGAFEVQNNGVPPTVSIAAPASGGVGENLAFQGSASGGSSPATTFAWDFGDGGSATGANASHAYSSVGAKTVTLTASDDKGCSAQASHAVDISGGGGPGGAPVLSGASLSGGRLRFTLDTNASVELTVTRKAKGRRVGKRCRRKAKKGKRCTLTVRVLRRTVAGTAGANSIKFPPKKLKPGRYTLTLVAVTDGKRSAPVKLKFRVKPKKRKR